MLEAFDERLGIFLRIRLHDEMHMVGHQDERKHDNPACMRLEGDEIHPHLEIFLIPKPKPRFQMFRSNQPQLPHNPSQAPSHPENPEWLSTKIGISRRIPRVINTFCGTFLGLASLPKGGNAGDVPKTGTSPSI
jgi:hypothetical protein